MVEFNAPDEELAAFLQGVGTVVVSWGLIEQSYDICVSELYHSGGKRFDKRIPQAIKQKIQFVRKCLRRDYRFEPLRILLIEFTNQVEALSNKRHDYIHSAIGFYCKETGKFTSHRMVNRGQYFETEEIDFIPEDYPVLAQQLMHLTREGHVVTDAVLLFSQSVQRLQKEELDYFASTKEIPLANVVKPPYYLTYWPMWPPWHR